MRELLADKAYRIVYRKPDGDVRLFKRRLYATPGAAKGVMNREKRYYPKYELFVEESDLTWTPLDG